MSRSQKNKESCSDILTTGFFFVFYLKPNFRTPNQHTLKTVEINPSGCFKNWKSSTLKELRNDPIGESFTGANLLFENDYIKLWDITLSPGERLPFSKKSTNYSWTCLSGGQTVSHCADGTIRMYKIEKGEICFFQFKNQKYISDIENVGKNIMVIHIVEYKNEVF